jgi:SpoU rRNA methylase family enzyme
MQITRMARTGNASLMIFDDFDDAVTTLLERMKEEF